jgi:hypothetical protein
MTISQNKYCYTDINLDSTHTIKGILEFTDVDGKDTACVFRVHLESRTVLISQLVHLPCSFEAQDNIAPNLIWKQHLESTGIQPSDLRWFNHCGTFSGHDGKADIRRPYQDTNPRTHQQYQYYTPVLIQWRENKFEYINPKEIRGRSVHDKLQIKFSESYFGTVEEITDRFNWRKGINRLDIEYRVDRLNSDSSKTIKTIYHWDHPDYPSHCLLRIVLHSQQAIILMSSLQSNIPPHRSVYGDRPINTLGECLIQVVNGIYQKYQYQLLEYQTKNIIWIYERGEFSTPDDRLVWHEQSYFRLVNLAWNNSKLDYFYPKNDEDNDNYISIKDESKITFLRSDRFGTVEESLSELGWFNL